MGNKITWNWRREFDQKTLDQGQEFLSTHVMNIGYYTFRETYPTMNYYADVTGVRALGARDVPNCYSKCAEYNEGRGQYFDNSKPVSTYGGTSPYTTDTGVFFCTCKAGIDGKPCKHMAAVGIAIETKFSDRITFEETQREEAERLKREEQEEQERRRAVPLTQVFLRKDIPEDAYFRMDQYIQDWTVSPEILKETREAVRDGNLCPVKVNFDESGEQQLYASLKAGNTAASLRLTANGWNEISCNCRACNQRVTPHIACRNLMLGFASIWEKIKKDNPGDLTDQVGLELIKNLTTITSVQPPARKLPTVQLVPFLDWTANTPRLRFSFLHPNGKSYALKALGDFTKSAMARGTFSFTPNVSIDFASYWFDEGSLPFFQLLEGEYGKKDNSARLLNSKSSLRGTAAQTNTGIFLQGSILDAFYDAALGMTLTCELPDKASVSVRVTYHQVRIHMSLDPEMKGDQLVGVKIKGKIPVIFEGATYRYTLDEEYLSRMSAQDLQIIAPYSKMFGYDGDFECVIGKRNLPTFLYRTVESFRENPQVFLTDHVSGRFEGELPPKGEYTYRLGYDQENNLYHCRATVAYGENEFSLPVEKTSASGVLRDEGLEALALEAAKSVFPQWSKDGEGIRQGSEDALFDILTAGTAEMERYGRVLAESDFPGIKVKAVPRPSLSVRISSGLLNLSVSTQDMSEEELLEVLAAYRKKKRYIRLHSGDFVDLENDTPFETLDEMLGSMNLTLEEAIQSQSHVPLFRALYVNQLLEDHDELANSRDRTFRAMIKNFKTIRDSEYEIPEKLEKMFRPYQMYGYKWLRTLAGAGFGGILADEMGLGKTAQMLALLSALKAEGEEGPSLVVCPASLVFNWKEEVRKFVPDLSVVTLSGTLKERGALLQEAQTEKAADLYVCSYDIARNDIAKLRPIQFSTLVLDEAQYIKNTKAAQTKSVKVLKARHRFALTGTPIENRLSELWSIMDFLMPGFLYSEGEFQRTFEVPIMKQKDEDLTLRLAKMTGPFILRRLKSEVLKELPEKLEEVRSAMMEEDQRKLYDAQVVKMKRMLEEGSAAKGEEKIRILAEITRLRQLCCDPRLIFEDYKGKSAKRQMCMDLITSAMDGGHRMLLFSQFTSMLALLEEDLKAEGIPYFKLTGSTPKEERIRLVNEFNENPAIPLFLISLKAGGTGLNLTGADIVIHYDPWWNLAVQNQATDRAHRIGQTKQVTVYKLVAASTIEEKIVALQESKRELAEAILGGESQSLMSLSPEELLDLLS